MPAEGGLTIEAAGLERTVHTIPWDPQLADLERSRPPSRIKNSHRNAEPGFVSGQHHLVVAVWLERAVTSMLRFAGCEDPYGRVCTNLPGGSTPVCP